MRIFLISIISILIVVTGLFIYNSGTKTNPEELTIYCAAGISNAINKLSYKYEKENNCKINISTSSSGTLAKQIEFGAEADIFISANADWMNYLVNKDFVNNNLNTSLIGNSLVFVIPKNQSNTTLNLYTNLTITEIITSKISLGDPTHVPAGKYAVQALKNLNWYNQFKPNFIPTKDVRSALMLVELNEVQTGIVYKNIALESSKIKVWAEIPDSLHSPINFVVGVLSNSINNKQAIDYYNFLLTEETNKYLISLGFK